MATVASVTTPRGVGIRRWPWSNIFPPMKGLTDDGLRVGWGGRVDQGGAGDAYEIGGAET